MGLSNTNSVDKVLKYDVLVEGNPGKSPTVENIVVRIYQPAGGMASYKFDCSTSLGLQKARMLIDLLRNEKNIYFDSFANLFAVSSEEVGEKDKSDYFF